MASININKDKIRENVVKEFPSLTKPENIVDLIATAVELDAVSQDNGITRAEFQAKGVKPYVVALGAKLVVLERTKVSKFRFLIVERGSRPKTSIETARALQLEREGLYKHLLHSAPAATTAAQVLKLPEGSSVLSIKKAMEIGTVQHQIDLYDKVFSALKDRRLYDETYDYMRICFRRKAARYWLSKLGKKLSR